MKYYEAVATHLKEVARLEGTNITWGGEWKQKDAVHFQIEPQ